jgi:hypothetical protein
VKARRYLCWVMVLAAAVHSVGIARSLLPAQDGLQFIRIARRFQAEPWPIVVQETDRHPLYPALIAWAEPALAAIFGHGPTTWRIAAQGVSAIASVALLVPLFLLARWLFDERTGVLTALLFVLLPLPAEIGHDTLSDPLALFLITLAFYWGARALQGGGLRSALGCAVAAGLGFLSRPEVIVVPCAVVAASIMGRIRCPAPRAMGARMGAIGVAFLFVVGLYAGLKGDISEKLALRWGRPYVVRSVTPRKATHSLPKGLDEPRWDFSPKEESRAAARMTPIEGAKRLVSAWAESLLWVFAVLGIVGACKARVAAGARWGATLALTYLLLFSAAVVMHATRFGYLSERYILSLLVVSLPWAAAGALWVSDWFARRRGWDEAGRTRRRWTAASLLVAACLVVQARSAHPSRWGHWAAGRWLAAHAGPTDAVLDTRGWAAFVSGLKSYDYWHVRQALSDQRLAYIVVGADELDASSARAATLRAITGYTCEPAARFPERRGESKTGVRIFRFQHPATWEGMSP